MPVRALNGKQLCLSRVLECRRELERAGEMTLTLSCKDGESADALLDVPPLLCHGKLAAFPT